MKFLTKPFRYLLTGTFFLLPFVITIGTLAWLGLFIAHYLGPNTFVGSWLVKLGFFSFRSNYPLLSYCIGLLIVLTIIALIGWIIERSWIKTIVHTVNELIKKIPIIGNFYNSICALVNAFNKNQMDNMTPVYCRFGGTMILALQPTADKFVVNEKTYVSVIIPTAPVPAGGAVLMVPEEDVIPANMKIEQFMSFYFSMGVTGKDFIPIRSIPDWKQVASK
ncbi:MAG: DUF502 domain-containing protein [Thermoguttaceae bacterium]|nr:DUF502 domain-containing protein [Thermoguttaceae bacterium]